MKKLYWISGVILTVVLLWLAWRWHDAPQVPLVQHVDKASTTVSKVDPPTDIESDPVKIFQRAFWASPGSEDHILHAERREWKDADGLQKWQWFLVVEPSAALLKRLRDDNAFGLMPAAAASPPADAPVWFAFNKDEVSVLKASQAKLQLIFSNDKHTLYATDSGLGFRAGAPEPIKPPPPPSSSPAMPRRLPSAHPPIPEPPADSTTGVPPVREDSASRLSAHETTGWKPDPVQLRNSNRRWTQMNTDKLHGSLFICVYLRPSAVNISSLHA